MALNRVDQWGHLLGIPHVGVFGEDAHDEVGLAFHETADAKTFQGLNDDVEAGVGEVLQLHDAADAADLVAVFERWDAVGGGVQADECDEFVGHDGVVDEFAFVGMGDANGYDGAGEDDHILQGQQGQGIGKRGFLARLVGIG